MLHILSLQFNCLDPHSAENKDELEMERTERIRGTYYKVAIGRLWKSKVDTSWRNGGKRREKVLAARSRLCVSEVCATRNAAKNKT